MCFKVEMRPGTLKGMEREVVCMVAIPVSGYSLNSIPTIQDAPNDLPEGEYIFTYKWGSILFRKHGGMWLARD